MELSIVPSEPEVPEVPELPNLGQTIDLFGYTWLVCHDDGSKKYLITKDIIKNVQWNTTDTTTGGYAESNIKKECDQFAKDTGIDQLDYVMDTGVGKVFIPTENQMFGESSGFDWFNSDERRVATLNGIENFYWTATPYSSSLVRFVSSSGNLDDYYYASDSRGFRPCICIDTTLYNS